MKAARNAYFLPAVVAGLVESGLIIGTRAFSATSATGMALRLSDGPIRATTFSWFSSFWAAAAATSARSWSSSMTSVTFCFRPPTSRPPPSLTGWMASLAASTVGVPYDSARSPLRVVISPMRTSAGAAAGGGTQATSPSVSRPAISACRNIPTSTASQRDVHLAGRPAQRHDRLSGGLAQVEPTGLARVAELHPRGERLRIAGRGHPVRPHLELARRRARQVQVGGARHAERARRADSRVDVPVASAVLQPQLAHRRPAPVGDVDRRLALLIGASIDAQLHHDARCQRPASYDDQRQTQDCHADAQGG